MAITVKATARRTSRVLNTLFAIESTLTDAEIRAAATSTVGAPQRNRPRIDDPEPGYVSFGNPHRVSWRLAYATQESGRRGYVLTEVETRRGRIVDAHEITFFLNALEGVLRRTDPMARVSERTFDANRRRWRLPFLRPVA